MRNVTEGHFEQREAQPSVAVSVATRRSPGLMRNVTEGHFEQREAQPSVAVRRLLEGGIDV